MPTQKSWKYLRRGDLVDLVAPGFRCSNEELSGAIKFVESLGLRPRVPKKIFAKDPLFSNTDAKRLHFLSEALLAQDSKAVWCLRGGYGSIRLLEGLKKLRPKSAKLVLGYSDITTLHLFLNQTWNWPTLHSPVLDRFGGGRAKALEIQEAKAILFGKNIEQVFGGLKPINALAKKSGNISGSVVGGNLAVLQSSLGTPYELACRGKILFLEDIGERPHRLDRMLTHLTQTKAFSGVRAVVFGDLVLSEDRERKSLWSDVVRRFSMAVDVPVLKGLKAGHGPIQRILPLNTKAMLSTGASPKLKVSVGGHS